MELEFSKREKDCVFCDIIAREAPASIVYEDRLTIAFLALDGGYPLVVPKKHLVDLFDPNLSDEITAAMGITERKMALLVRDTLRVGGVTRVTTTGKDSGQEIFHLHTHIMPRVAGDKLVRLKRGEVLDQATLEQIGRRYRRKLSRRH